MTPIAYAEAGSVKLIAVAYVETLKTTSDKGCHGVGRAASHTHIHVFLLMSILQTRGHIATIGHPVSAHEKSRVYSKKRISQLNIVSTCQLICSVYLQFIRLTQLYQGGCEVLNRKTDIPPAVLVIETRTQVKRLSVKL